MSCFFWLAAQTMTVKWSGDVTDGFKLGAEGSGISSKILVYNADEPVDG